MKFDKKKKKPSEHAALHAFGVNIQGDGRRGRSGRSGQSGQSGRRGQSGQSGQSDRSGRSGRSGQSDRSGQSGQSGRSGHSGRSNSPPRQNRSALFKTPYSPPKKITGGAPPGTSRKPTSDRRHSKQRRKHRGVDEGYLR